MAVKLNVEVQNLNKLLKKLDYKLIKDDVDEAVGNTANAAVGPLRSLIPFGPGRPPLGHLSSSLQASDVSDRGRGKRRGGPTSGLSAAYVAGNWYGRFPDRGTVYIKRRGWSGKARTQVKPTADAEIRKAGNRIAQKWGKP